MKKFFTVWYESDLQGTVNSIRVKAVHVSSNLYPDAQTLLVFYNKKWQVVRTEQLRKIHRIQGIHNGKCPWSTD